MGAVTGTVTEMSPALGTKTLLVTAPATTDDTDTIEVDLSSYGCSTFVGIIGYTHTTTGSVVTMEDPTTAVSGTTLTITVGGSTDLKARAFVVYALAADDTNIEAP